MNDLPWLRYTEFYQQQKNVNRGEWNVNNTIKLVLFIFNMKRYKNRNVFVAELPGDQTMDSSVSVPVWASCVGNNAHCGRAISPAIILTTALPYYVLINSM